MPSRTVLALAALVVLLAPCYADAGRNVPGGEWAYPKYVPYEDPPPTVLWGPFVMSDLRGLQWGLYGLSYQGLNDQLHANYFWQNRVRRYRSVDSTNPARPETIIHSYVPSPVSDSFQDLAYCRYDRTVWMHSSKFKKVFKLDAVTGELLREFPTPCTRYPTGIAFNERAKLLYLVDRMPEGGFPCSLYVTDTMGYVLRRFGLGHLGYSYAGARCIDFDYTNTNANYPTLLMIYSYFSSSGSLDSCGLFELDPDSLTVVHRAKLPNLSGQVNNCRGVAWDPRSGDYWITIMQNPDNYIYKMDGWYTPASVDIGIMSLVAPRGVYDSATSIVPQVVLRNYGTSAVDCPVRLKIGTDYDETRTKNIRAGAEDTVNFPTWQTHIVGTYPARCSTLLAGDMFACNDTWTEITQVVRLGLDIGCHRLVAPVGVVDSGVPVTPSCSTFNHGNLTVAYPVRMKIGTLYEQTASVTGHMPGQFAVVQFPPWTPTQLGSFAVSCSTELAGDTLAINDRKTGSVRVRVLDAACTRLLGPSGILDSGAVVTPACSVYNRGSDTVTYDVRMRVGTFYDQAVAVASHAPATYRYLTFPDWTAEQVGAHVVRCSTELAGDLVPANNRRLDSVVVRAMDVGVAEIIAPAGTIDSGTAVMPRAKIKNYRGFAVSFPVICRIGTFYADTQNVTNLAPYESTLVDFDQWNAVQRGAHSVRCTTRLNGDMNPANDAMSGSVMVRVRDAAASAILAPRGQVVRDSIVIPLAVVRNLGTGVETFPVRFAIGGFYARVETVTVAAGAVDTVEFAAWTADTLGTHATRCSTLLAGDRNPANDVVRDSVTVVPRTGLAGHEPVPAAFALEQGRPTPFARQTVVRYALPRACPVTLQVFGASGVLVRSFAAEQAAGYHRWTWNGCDERGRRLARGIYYCRLHAGEFRATRKLVKSE